MGSILHPTKSFSTKSNIILSRRLGQREHRQYFTFGNLFHWSDGPFRKSCCESFQRLLWISLRVFFFKGWMSPRTAEELINFCVYILMQKTSVQEASYLSSFSIVSNISSMMDASADFPLQDCCSWSCISGENLLFHWQPPVVLSVWNHLETFPSSANPQSYSRYTLCLYLNYRNRRWCPFHCLTCRTLSRQSNSQEWSCSWIHPRKVFYYLGGHPCSYLRCRKRFSIHQASRPGWNLILWWGEDCYQQHNMSRNYDHHPRVG